MSTTLSGPMFEQSDELFKAQPCLSCGKEKHGAHYNHYIICGGMAALKCLFPDAQANKMNFALFSTSGVHGTYETIEDIEEELKSDDDTGHLTVTIIQPRLCCIRYGVVEVKREDLEYLKKLRRTSWAAAGEIGK